MAGFGGAVKLTGESEYRRALRQCTQSLREMSSELKAVSSSYDKNDSSASSLESQQKQLTSVLERQKSTLSTLKTQYAAMSSEFTAQTAKHKALQSSYDSEKAKLQQIGQTLGTTSQEYQEQQKVVDGLAQELKKSTTAQDANEKSMSQMRIAINRAQTDCNATAKELDKLGNEAKEAGDDAKKGGDGFTVMKGVLANLATSAIQSAINGLKQLGAAVVDVGKQAVDSYANYEQLVGGVETLFGDSASIVEGYANNAYKTAGLSANQYMETVTSFSASLLQGLNGDTAAAAKVADVAISDMSDNANKMGTSMSSIQDAYQGFAKQNYTMLDNLKLGYGGTQSEMARLINDSGVLGDTMEVTAETVNDVSYDKIIEAIHKVQSEMGITGTTAEEAAKTLEGSKNAMTASYQNLMTGIADENQKVGPLFSTLVDSIGTYMGNLLPRITETLSGMTEAVRHAMSTLFPKIQEMMTANLPQMIQEGTKLIMALVQGLVQSLPLMVQGIMIVVNNVISTIGTLLPQIVTTVVQVVPQLISSLMEQLPIFIQSCVTFLNGMVQAVPVLIQELVAALPTVITALIDGLMSGIDALIQGAVSLLDAIVQAIPIIIPTITAAMPTIINTLVNGLIKALPQLLQGAITLLEAIVQAIPLIIPPVVAALPQLITTIITTLTSNIPLIVDAGIQLLTALVQNMPAIIAGVSAAIPTIVTSIFDALVTGVPQIAQAGVQLIQGLWDGIKNMGGWLMEQVSGFASSVVDGFCSFFGINSPSTVMRDRVGKNLAEGVGEGFSDEISSVSAQMAAEGGETVDQLSQGMDKGKPSVTKTAQQLAKAIMDTFSKSKGSFTNVGKTIASNIATGIRSGMSAIKSLATQIAKQVVSAFSSASGSFRSTGAKVASQVNAGIKSGQAAIAATAKAIANAIVTAFTSQASKMQATGKKLATQVNAGIKSGQSAIVSTVKAITKAIANAFTSLASTMQSAGKRLVTQVGHGMNSGKASVVSTAKGIASSAASGVGSYRGTFSSMGVQLASGLKGGFLSQEGSVRSAVVGMVSRIVSAAKANQKINSPSRVWAEMGGYMAEGMSVGFTDGMGATNKTMLASMNDMLNGVLDFWGISSPSKKMRDKVGKQLVAGVSSGIKNNTKLVTSAVKTLNTQITALSSDYSASAKSIVKTFTSSIKTSLKDSEAKAKQSWTNWYNAQVKANEQAQKKLEKRIAATKSKSDKAQLKRQLESLKSQKATLTKEYKSLGKDVLKAFNSAMETATKGVTDELATNIQSIADTMQERLDEVNKLIDDMSGKLKDYGDIFAIDSAGIVDLADLEEQTKNIQKYGQNLEALKGKISSTLMEQITSMGIDDGLAFTQKLLNISADELKAYDKAYTAKVAAANSVASKFYGEQVSKIKSDYTSKVTKALEDAKKQIETIGKQTMQGFVKGMKSFNWAKDVKSIANNIIKSFKKQLKISSPSRVFMEMGEYSGEGYTIGLADELASVSKVMASAMPSDMTGKMGYAAAQNGAATYQNEGMTPDKMVSAFKDALSQMKIELDDDEVGRFVDRTVTRLVYS